MPMNWDGDANQKLLLCILAVHEIKVDFAAVATTLGPDCTPRAVQEQLKKLKKQSLAQMGGTSTPSKAKAKKTDIADSPATKTSTPVSKAKAKKTDDVDAPTAKKRKVTAPRSNVKKAKNSSQSLARNLIKEAEDEGGDEEGEAGDKPFKSIFGSGANQAPEEGDEDEEALNAQLADEMGEMVGEEI